MVAEYIAPALLLMSTSPCIDAGIHLQWMEDAVDLDGSKRSRGGMVDIGCYEQRPPHKKTVIIVQ